MAKSACSVEGCSKESSTRGWCEAHYTRWRTHGDPTTYLRPIYDGASCVVDGCDLRPRAKGMCVKHYRRARGGRPLNDKPRMYGDTDVCSVVGCSKPRRQREWCSMHYNRWLKTGDTGPAESLRWQARKGEARTCVIDGCESNPKARGWCAKHYRRWQVYGDPMKSKVEKVCRDYRGAKCSVDNCDRLADSRTLCAVHYQRWRWINRPQDRPTRIELLRQQTPVGFTVQQVDERLRYWGNKCWMCGGPQESVDHVKPLTKGGLHCLANFRPACMECNQRKTNLWYGVANLHRFLRTPDAA